ncbi:fungal zn(2)-Cys(6) binuclear cluster domain-containing protein [Trichoderma breve]|uniref:Fungal zn(2)-Cys(6) binuclear cluster domain-containing protein n=1 Tax=Trichoderma breve TaxID=2034170 RepID=A0A9W9E4F0_9HYPO|nr:fungal zn(2)-Cys(6) binuclear cluster domain-containing protein [Trichoderma breve]KAJ4856207.1 fungal zn(2)-Cys(6) binuclear cluster domain-containing protein [Trichoderma breve]
MAAPGPGPAATVSAENSYQTPAATPTGSPDPDGMEPSSSSSSIGLSMASAIGRDNGSASGSGSEAPKKRNRRSNPKVKTGCLNCKQRRIKCDEMRPACSQCVRSKKECTGYPAPSRGTRAALDVRIAPKPLVAASAGFQHLQPAPSTIASASTSTTASLLLTGHTIMLPPRRVNRRKRQTKPLASNATMPFVYEPSHNLALMHTESLYFDLFRVQTASELSGYFDSTFWTQRVLQECHFEPSIRHAVVALGALYKTLEQSCEPDSTPLPGAMSRLDSVMCHWQVAVRKYSEACNAMLHLSGNKLATNKTRLMASVLLACFDSFIGDHRQAIVQIQTGLGLLARIQYDRTQAPQSNERVEEDLLIIFTRLAIQAKSLQDPSSPLSDMDQLCEMLLRFIEHLQHAKKEPSYTLPPSWRQLGATFQGQIDSWSEAFEPIFQSRLQPGMNLLEKSGIAALKMFQINTNVIFLTIFCDAEVQFDGFLPHFKAIVSLGWEVVGDDEKRAATERCPDPQSFSADLGIVPPLFVVATKCREPNVRREAIQLLRSSARREGMWDSELTANIAQWIMEVEESENPFPEMNLPGGPTQAVLPSRAIPEEKRIMVQSVDFDLRERFAQLTVGSRDLRQGMKDRRHKATRITW